MQALTEQIAAMAYEASERWHSPALTAKLKVQAEMPDNRFLGALVAQPKKSTANPRPSRRPKREARQFCATDCECIPAGPAFAASSLNESA